MSDAMKALQAKVGAKPDGSFGTNTARAIAKHYELSPARGAHLLGQASHESGGFKLVRENLNYSAETMVRVWPSRFKTVAEAQPFARNPKVWLTRFTRTAWAMAMARVTSTLVVASCS
jgi:predicted chitinase